MVVETLSKHLKCDLQLNEGRSYDKKSRKLDAGILVVLQPPQGTTQIVHCFEVTRRVIQYKQVKQKLIRLNTEFR